MKGQTRAIVFDNKFKNFKFTYIILFVKWASEGFKDNLYHKIELESVYLKLKCTSSNFRQNHMIIISMHTLEYLIY